MGGGGEGAIVDKRGVGVVGKLWNDSACCGLSELSLMPFRDQR